MSELLARMARSSRARVLEARFREAESVLRRRALEDPPARPLVLSPAGFDLIAEIKREAPSSGRLTDGAWTGQALVAHARAYVESGAAAVSVLTEPDAFSGSLADLAAVSAAVDRPTMRKDFLVDPYQVFEARAHGAGGVLLIVRMLDDARMCEMLEAASEAGLFALVEVFDADDVHRARRLVEARPAPTNAPPVLFGVNSRDLKSLAVDRARFESLRGLLPAKAPAVAESGLETEADVAGVARLGYRVALIGRALMRCADPRATVECLLRAGRRGAERCASG